MFSRRIPAILLLLCACAAGAQSGDADGKPKGAQAGSAEAARGEDRPFTLEVVGSAKRALAYGDPIVLTLRIKRTADAEFEDLHLTPLGDLQSLYDAAATPKAPKGGGAKAPTGTDPPEEEPAEVATCEQESNGFGAAGTTMVATCQLVAKDGGAFWRPSAWLLSPGQQQVLVKIPVKADDGGSGDQDTPSDIYYEEVPVAFRAPLSAIFLGGLAGAFLLALFTAVRAGLGRPAMRLEVPGWGSLKGVARKLGVWVLNLFPQAWKMLLETVMGGICAIILILLAQSTEGLSPPISIKIQDFWGGVVTGLFSIPLSRWIWSQVHPEPPIPPSAPPPAPPAEEEKPADPDEAQVPPSTPEASPPEANGEKAPEKPETPA